MKKIFYLFTFIALFLSACNPNEEIYDELDKNAAPFHNTINYTLLAADYTKAAGYARDYAENKADSTMADYISTFQAFNEQYTGNLFIPSILPGLFPAYNKNSIAIITYNYFAQMPDEYAVITDAPVFAFNKSSYELVDYKVSGAGYFYPEFNPDIYIPEVLDSMVTSPATDALYNVQYQYADANPVLSLTSEFDETFDVGLGKFNAVSVTGTQVWARATFGADTYAKMAGFTGGTAYVNEDWLISNPIELGNDALITFSFTHAIRYLNDHWEQLSVAISTDYNGIDPTSATWDVIDWGDIADTASLGSSYTKYSSGDIDISSYKDSTIYIAFKYTSDLTNQPTWQIYDVNVNPIKPVYSVVTGLTPYTVNDYYKFTGSLWEKQGNISVLSSKDYEAMGAPGTNNNFSTSIKPMDYLPKFLDNKYPLAGEGFSAYVVYKYYVNSAIGTKTIADKLTNTSGEWVSSYSFIKSTTEQFINNGDYWVFDPTVKFTMSSNDYQLIVDEDPIPDPAYTNNAWYYGASAYYSNFDLRLAKHVQYEPETFTGLTEAEAVAILYPRVQEAIVVLLQKKFPAAVKEVSGVPVHYLVSYQTYNSDYTRTNYQVDYLCTESASGTTPATFELQEGYPKVL
jgi:hypothetical protein